MRNRKNEVLLVLRVTRLIFNHEGHTSTTLSAGSGTQRKQSEGNDQEESRLRLVSFVVANFNSDVPESIPSTTSPCAQRGCL
jgi:hypothetical protein